MEQLTTPNRKASYYLIHICAWVTYGSFIYIANRLTEPRTSVIGVLLFLLPFCITFYANIYCLNILKRSVARAITLLITVFLVMTAIGYCYIYYLLPSAGMRIHRSDNVQYFLQTVILGYFQYLAYGLLYFYVKETLRKETEVRKLKEEKLQGELENALSQKEKLQFEYAFLRAQINPHFLHNTLNVLFSQALEYSEDLADNIHKLSGMMRYCLESVEYDNGQVAIGKELEHLQTLLDIHHIRFAGTKVIQYCIVGETDCQQLPPLSLITIVENAFKYGDLKDESNPLQIKVVLKPRCIYFYCRNKKRKHHIQFSSLNIGITNLSRRLDVAFKDKYKIDVTDEEDFYTFELTIKN